MRFSAFTYALLMVAFALNGMSVLGDATTEILEADNQPQGIHYNTTCLRLSVDVTFEFIGNNTKKYDVPVPAGEVSDVNCSPNLVSYKYEFAGSTWNFVFEFENGTTNATDSASDYALTMVSYQYDLTALNATEVTKIFGVKDIEDIKQFGIQLSGMGSSTKMQNWPVHAPVSQAYTCQYGDTRLPVDENVALVLEKLRVQVSFGNSKLPDSWVDGATCDADSTQSEWVPIVVGACLGLLVITVLIGYLIGRARARRQGYASV